MWRSGIHCTVNIFAAFLFDYWWIFSWPLNEHCQPYPPPPPSVSIIPTSFADFCLLGSYPYTPHSGIMKNP